MNKSVFTLMLIFNLILNFASAQQVEIHRSKADSLRNEGDLQLAIKEFARLYEEDSLNSLNTYNYACALAVDKQIDDAFYYLNIATSRDTSVRTLNDPDFYFLIGDERWGKLQDKLISRVEAKYGKYENLELSKELWTMKIRDQAFYYHLNVANKEVGNDSPIITAIWELKKQINEQNVERINRCFWMAEKISSWRKCCKYGVLSNSTF